MNGLERQMEQAAKDCHAADQRVIAAMTELKAAHEAAAATISVFIALKEEFDKILNAKVDRFVRLAQTPEVDE